MSKYLIMKKLLLTVSLLLSAHSFAQQTDKCDLPKDFQEPKPEKRLQSCLKRVNATINDLRKHIKYIKKPTVCTFNTGSNKSKVVCTNELFSKTYINIDDDLFDDSQKIKFPKKSIKFYDYKIVDDENYYLLKLCTDRAILLDIHGTGYVFYDYNKMNKK